MWLFSDQQMMGGIRLRLPTDTRPNCQITLKRRPVQRGLSQCVGLSLLQHVRPYVHRDRGTISYVFLCLYLSCCLYCAHSALSLSPSLCLSVPSLLWPSALLLPYISIVHPQQLCHLLRNHLLFLTISR